MDLDEVKISTYDIITISYLFEMLNYFLEKARAIRVWTIYVTSHEILGPNEVPGRN